MNTERNIMGLFSEEDQTAAAVKALRQSPFPIRRVNGPFPSHKISAALNQKKSRVGYFTLIGGIIGLLSGFGLAIFTAVQWNLIVGGKPVVALIPFVIVGFEFTILFAVFGNIVGMLLLTRLPTMRIPEAYDIRCTGTHFSILVSCGQSEEEELKALIQRNGGEISLY